jgi:ligand-binding SRPBCC domain-containing protein
VDEMVEGIFKGFRHEHLFEEQQGQTLMRDVFSYTSPLGWLGKFADVLFIKRYMRNLLLQRNLVIKDFAESNGCRKILE